MIKINNNIDLRKTAFSRGRFRVLCCLRRKLLSALSGSCWDNERVPTPEISSLEVTMSAALLRISTSSGRMSKVTAYIPVHSPQHPQLSVDSLLFLSAYKLLAAHFIKVSVSRCKMRHHPTGHLNSLKSQNSLTLFCFGHSQKVKVLREKLTLLPAFWGAMLNFFSLNWVRPHTL